MLVALAKIKVDSSLQSRASLDPEQVNNIAAVFKAQGADAIPPGEVMDDGEHLWLWDAFHRYHAAQKAGLTEMHVNVTKGTHREAILKAAGANAEHNAKMRTDGDKRRAVQMVLEDSEWCEMSGRWVGEHCKVSHTFVEDIRTEMNLERSKKAGNSSQGSGGVGSTGTGRDGKRQSRTKAPANHFTMCERCSRLGKPACKACIFKKNEGKEPLVKGQKPKKSGDALVDWKAADTNFGALVRAIDEVAKGYKDKGPEFNGLHRLMSEFHKLWDGWRKKCLKAEKA